MGTHKWTVAEAKAKFSEVIDRAQSDGPQTITRKGRKAAVVVGATAVWRSSLPRRRCEAPGCRPDVSAAEFGKLRYELPSRHQRRLRVG
jgi:prevent-host-death family protein